VFAYANLTIYGGQCGEGAGASTGVWGGKILKKAQKEATIQPETQSVIAYQIMKRKRTFITLKMIWTFSRHHVQT